MSSKKHAELPLSPAVLRVVAQSLPVSGDVLRGRTARRYFSGGPVNEHDRDEVFRALGNALIEAGVVPDPDFVRDQGLDLAPIVADALKQAATRWDLAVGDLQSSATRRIGSTEMLIDLLRPLAVDLAVRAFAITRLAGIALPSEGVPIWAQERGFGLVLRRAAADANLTRPALAGAAGVAESSLDLWMDGGGYPTATSLSLLADAVGRDRSADALKNLSCQLVFAKLCDALAEVIGRERAVDLVVVVIRIARLMSDDVGRIERPPIEEACGAEIEAFRLGTAGHLVHTLLRNAAHDEPDAVWKSEQRSAATPWSVRFQMAAVRHGEANSSAGLAQEPPEGWTETTESEAARAPLFRMMSEEGQAAVLRKALRVGSPEPVLRMLESSIQPHRHNVAAHPLAADAHFGLGADLGLLANYTRKRDVVEEAISECRIAAELSPGWDAPLVEIGIIHINVGQFEQAVRELDAAEGKLGQATPHLLNARGYAKMRLGRFADALADYDGVLAVNPDYAEALRNGGHCAFIAGDGRKGREYAKRARRLGEPGTFIAWKEGRYSGQATGKP